MSNRNAKNTVSNCLKEKRRCDKISSYYILREVICLVNKLTRTYKVPVSGCDHSSKLSFIGIFNLFMDIATEHADILNISNEYLREKNCFWVAAKTRVKVLRRPMLNEEIQVATWPEKPGNIRCNRYCTLSDTEGVIVEAKTEWTILDGTTGKPQKTKDIYPESLEHLDDVVCAQPFERFKTDFSVCEEIGTHKVVSADIDMSRHMNNVAYIRMALSAFTCEELDKMNIEEIEIAYKVQCYEGEVLSIRRLMTDSGMEIGILKEDGTCGAVMKIL